MKPQLFADPAARTARAAEKKRLTLRWLRTEIYTTAELAADLVGLRDLRPVVKMFTQMEAEGLVRREDVTAPSGKRYRLFGITSHGQGMAWDRASGEEWEERVFETGRVGLTVLEHRLGLQQIRIMCENAGWAGWLNPDRDSGKWAAGRSRPDALATSPEGVRFAIEFERSLKAPSRYVGILADRLMAIKAGDYQRVVWVSPTTTMLEQLRARLLKIEAVPVAGRMAPVDPERHHRQLAFATPATLLATARG